MNIIFNIPNNFNINLKPLHALKKINKIFLKLKNIGYTYLPKKVKILCCLNILQNHFAVLTVQYISNDENSWPLSLMDSNFGYYA